MLIRTFPFSLPPPFYYSRQEKALPKVGRSMHICTYLCALSPKSASRHPFPPVPPAQHTKGHTKQYRFDKELPYHL